MEKEQKKKLYKMGLPIIMGTILLIGVSYAWLSLTLNGTKTNVLRAGTLSLTLTDTATSGINIEGAVPMLDEVGVTTSPYTFTLKNNGTIDSEYTIYLDDVALNSGETKLPDEVIKYNLVKDNVSMSTALLNTIGSNPNRILDSGVIASNETYNYDLRLWLDENMTLTDAGKVFRGKIRVVAEQIKEKAPTPEECFTFNDSTGLITKYLCGPKVYNSENNTINTNTSLPAGVSEFITDVVIPNTINGKTVTRIGGHAFNGNEITSVMIPDGVITLDYRAFYQNRLTSVMVPSKTTTIGEEAFKSNQLTSITIPSNITGIGRNAFQNNQLTSVIIRGKSSSANFTTYPSSSPFGWASGYSDSNITWQP